MQPAMTTLVYEYRRACPSLKSCEDDGTIPMMKMAADPLTRQLGSKHMVSSAMQGLMASMVMNELSGVSKTLPHPCAAAVGLPKTDAFACRSRDVQLPGQRDGQHHPRPAARLPRCEQTPTMLPIIPSLVPADSVCFDLILAILPTRHESIAPRHPATPGHPTSSANSVYIERIVPDSQPHPGGLRSLSAPAFTSDPKLLEGKPHLPVPHCPWQRPVPSPPPASNGCVPVRVSVSPHRLSLSHHRLSLQLSLPSSVP